MQFFTKYLKKSFILLLIFANEIYFIKLKKKMFMQKNMKILNILALIFI